MIKHLFSDLDGTLLNNNGKLSDYTKKIIGVCNIPLTLVSARSPQKMESILSELGVGGIHIAFNGAMVFKKENNKFSILNKKILDREFARKLVLDIRSKFPKVGISLYDTNNWNVDLVNKVIEREKKIVKVNYNLVDFNKYFNENLKEVYKVSFIEDDIEVFRKLVDYVEVNYSDEKITIQKSLSSYLEITHTNAKKSLGIEYVIKLKNIDRDSTVAFGDGENDISMLQSAGYSIVMGNASDKVKEYADFITKSNNEDGVAYVIEKIINNQDLK
ncbi:Cof-type HAD-IIB family hydrolase [Gemella sanguinis]